MRRVVVTGIGLVSPLGGAAAASWANLIAGRSGVRKIPTTMFETSDLETRIAGLIPGPEENGGLNLEQYLSQKEIRRADKFICYAIAAAIQAVEDSGILSSQFDPCRAGTMVGSGIGGLATIEENVCTLRDKGPSRVNPFFIPASLINLAAGHISIKYGFKGPNHASSTACSSGAHAIGDSARMISWGDADIMIAGGSEAAVCRMGISGFNACKALSTSFNDQPEQASRPWDAARDGFVMGEGSGILILEEYEHAKKRGAKIYAELVGYGLTGDAHHITAPHPDGDGGFRAMKMALDKAGIDISEVDYINAHGTSTPLGDLIELNAIRRLFSGAAKMPLVSSTKSAIGHLLGAAGSVEAVFSVLSIKNSVIPATLNLHNPPEGCNIDLVPHTARDQQLSVVLSNSFGFGGTNASLLFKKV